MTATTQPPARTIASAIAAMFLAGLCLTAAAGPAVQVPRHFVYRPRRMTPLALADDGRRGHPSPSGPQIFRSIAPMGIFSRTRDIIAANMTDPA